MTEHAVNPPAKVDSDEAIQDRTLAGSVDELVKAIRALVPKSPVQAEELLTAEQVGDLFRISPRTLRDLAATGRVPHRRIGKHYRFSRDDIVEIIRRAGQSHNSRTRRSG
ncbi:MULTISPECIES: helix-turn-helix domain-containing protein [Actinokineospora]|uniref:DNA binding domain-containing protein, excisionase family n=1 Tax=Actinokineospora diospyrosa TaxID=103728 RepID=A0ABT1I5S1_9PSEU|nr:MULTISPECIES: helix-turn-helix domain-containing protein [Actinokineospora]MCP2267919.1 DNA binding domain-containing protein, excisionase family [Actinokineospora diospyrosa]MCP2304087.1 DNA binding domain-containing protein, excisionase family [Actinokineospora globicatena]GLW78563.1 hypothetical protein Aglo01_30450 [Actinokineospora globicatena]GLW84773.1 hypothetical protein Aglo02_24130 [Actinokineospora globicatena]